jgi:hypothetical protein
VYRTVQETGGSLQVRDPRGTIQSLQQLEPWEAERTLGVRLAPDGNMTIQYEWMLQTAHKWADTIRAGHLPRHLTWLAWRSTILKTMEYPLPTTTLTERQCDKITSVIAAATLPRSGIMRSFPRRLLHAPVKAGGLNVPNLYVEQGIGHITRLIRYSRSRRHSTGILLRNTCEALKLEIGCNGFLLDNPWSLAPLAADSWIKSTWQFVHEHGIEIQDDIDDFYPLREFDQLLIPIFHRLGYRGNELVRLNQCRLYLGVTWLSEIATGDGKRIEQQAIDHPYKLDIKELFLYPTQHFPPKESWQIWRRAVAQLCDPNGKLKQPLGVFLHPESIQWWFEPEAHRLFRTGKSIIMYRKAPGKRTRACDLKYIRTATAVELPEALLPVTVLSRHDTVYITGVGELGAISTSNISGHWVLDHVNMPRNFDIEWAKANGELRAVSDGSYKDSHGTAAWMIHVTDKCVITSRCITPGSPQSQSAYRSELAGLYCVTYYVRFLEKTKHIHGRITVGCDGMSALDRAGRKSDFIDPNEPQFDLIMAIRSMVADTGWEWNWKHVKGHQDDSQRLEDLDNWSQWNIKMDAEAKQFWKETSAQRLNTKIEGEPWRVIVAGEKATSNLRESLRETCNFKGAMEYWNSKRRFGNCNINEIDWDSMGRAMRASTIPRQHWVSKMISGFCATGKMMKRRKERSSDECPRCGSPEDVCHVWMCQHETQDLWTKALENLSTWMLENNTPPEIRMAIIKGLKNWRKNDGSEVTTQPEWVLELVRKQSSCGWRNFFEGFLVKDWGLAMKKHWSRIGPAKSPKRWVSALIQKLWQTAWDLWEHRNGYLHDKDDSILIRQLNKEIEYQFELGTAQLKPNTKALFRPGLAAILKKPIDIKSQWVRRVELAREVEGVNDHDTYRTERTAMAKWLGR